NSVVTSGRVRNTTTNYVYNDLSAAATFSVVTAGQTGSLPVTLASFTAAKEGNVAQLAWSTSFETNSDYFEVQRSTDGKRFGVLDKVPAWTESQTLRRYSFTDKLPESGSNIYRLKMVDKDGTFAYSMLRNVEF